MKDLRIALSTYLKTLHPRVYCQEASKDAAFPYIVFDISSFPDGEGFELITLDVEGWDSNITGDSTAIEDLMSTINGQLDEEGNPTGLDKRTFSTSTFLVTFYLENKMGIKDDDKRIKRKKYTYAGRLYR